MRRQPTCHATISRRCIWPGLRLAWLGGGIDRPGVAETLCDSVGVDWAPRSGCRGCHRMVPVDVSIGCYVRAVNGP
jgi:hypothetical protein